MEVPVSQATLVEEDVLESIHIEVEEPEMTEAVTAKVRTVEIEITHLRSTKDWIESCGFLRISKLLTPELLKKHVVHLSDETGDVEIMKERELLVTLRFDRPVTTERVRIMRQNARYSRVGIDHMCAAMKGLNLLFILQPELSGNLVVNPDATVLDASGKTKVVCYSKGQLIALNENTRWPPGTMFLAHTVPEEAWQRIVKVPKQKKKRDERNPLLDYIRHNTVLNLIGLTRAPEPAAPDNA